MDRWLEAAIDYIPRWLEFQIRATERPGVALAIHHGQRTVLDAALLTQLLMTQLPEFVAARLQDFEQGQRQIYRKLNLVPVVLAGILRVGSWALVGLALAVVAHRFGKLEPLFAIPGAAPLRHVFELIRPLPLVFVLMALGLRWGAAFFKSRSFVKAQRDES